jgi:hypothetical protein
MVITADGNVGIGIANSESKLHIVQSSENFSSGIKIVGSTSPISGRIWMGTEKLHIDNATAGTGTGLTLLKNGLIGIGTADPQYKLDVIGTIRSREVKVDLNGADFVFEEDYRLMPLNELEKFVKEQKHLPEIAPAKEMEKNGTELGDLNSKLLQKIEEMTLYMIEQNKKIEQLQEQNKELQALKERIAKLEAASK